MFDGILPRYVQPSLPLLPIPLPRAGGAARGGGHPVLWDVAASLTALACLRLLCRRERLPYTGREALLPRRWVEATLVNTLGLAMHYMYPVYAVAQDLGNPFAILAFNRSLGTAGAPRSGRHLLQAGSLPPAAAC